MTEMQNFCSWFLSELPNFLLSNPIKYFLGFWFLAIAMHLAFKIINIK